MNAFASLLAYTGLVSLALAMARHHRTVFAREIAPRRRLALRFAGWLLLSLSVSAAFRSHGPELGAVAWFSSLAFAGFVLTLLLSYAPRLWPLPLASLLLLAVFASRR